MIMLNKPELVTLRNTVATARYGLTVNQQKAFLEVAAFLKANPDKKFVRLYIREFLSNINVRTNALTDLIADIKRMTTIAMNIPLTQKKGEIRFIDAGLFASAEFQIDNNGLGYVEIEVSEKLKPYIIEAINGDFFSFKLPNTRVLKSNYSIKIYMILKSWKRFKKFDVSYEELRSILNIEPHEYRLFGDFKRRILDRAQSEIDEKTDIKFTYSLIRSIPNNPNTEVTRVVFNISETGKEEITTNPQIPLQLTSKNEEPLKLLSEIDPKVSKIEASEFFDNLDLPEERLMDILLYARDEIKRGNQIRSLFAYIVKGSKTPAMGQGMYQRTKEKQEEENRNRKLKKDHETIKAHYNRDYEAFKSRYIYDLGVSAPNERKHLFMNNLLDEIARFPTLKSVYFDRNEQLKQEVARDMLGGEIFEETMTDDKLFIKYMQDTKAIGVLKNGEYWCYAPNADF